MASWFLKIFIIGMCFSLCYTLSDNYQFAESEIDSNGGYKVVYKISDSPKFEGVARESGGGGGVPRKISKIETD
ncbi:hypothetical protein Trydic_g12458 [Trypoxylus dichotomus]